MKDLRSAHGDFYIVKTLDSENKEALSKLIKIAKLL